MTIVFIAVVQAVVVSVADVDPGYAIAVITGKQVAETCTSFGLAVFWRLISTIAAVVVAIAIPGSWYTSVVGTSEAVRGTGSLATMQRILVRVVATVVVTVAQPVGLHADICLLAF